MGEKPFLLFGRRQSPEEAAKQQKISELDTQLNEKRKELASLKREADRMLSEVEGRAAQLKNEEKALQSLRNEVARRIKQSEEKEGAVRGMERQMAQREKVVHDEEARIQALQREEQEVKLRIEALEHAFAEKKAAVDERQKAVLKLTQEMGALMRQRTEAKKLEEGMKATVAKDQQLRAQASKIERRVADGAKLVAAQEEEIAKHKMILEQLRMQIRQMVELKKKIDAELSQQQKGMQASKRELADMEDAVKNVMLTKDALEKRAMMLSQRERQLEAQESRIDQQKKELERLQAGVETIEKNRQTMAGLIEDKKHLLEELKSSIAENSKTIQELHGQEQEARRAAAAELAAKRENDKKLKLLEARAKELTQRESVLVEHERGLKEATQALAKDRKTLADEVNARKAELLLLQQEWEKKMGGLKEARQEMQLEKEDVRKLVESDVIGLKDKEEELVETIAFMERDKKNLEIEEQSLMKRVAELERAKAAFEREKNALRSKEKRILDGERIIQKGMNYIESEKRKTDQEKDKVYRARELKKMLPQMERRYEELRKMLGKTQARMIERGVRPSMGRVLKERERELSMRTKGIELETGRLMEREHEVEELEARKERAFNEYLREEVERAQLGKPGREVVNPEIHAMIDDAREKVMQGDLDAAARMVAEAEYLVDKVQNPSQKRLLMYDIRDVKTSIKLAMLT